MKRNVAQGSAAIQFIGVIFISLMFSAVAIDLGYFFTAQNQLQSAADAAALAATKELFTSNALDAGTRLASARTQASSLVDTYGNSTNLIKIDPATDVTFGYIDPVTKQYNAGTFATASNDPNLAKMAGFNATKVTVKRTANSASGKALGTIFSRMFGVNSMDAQANAVAMMDGTITQVSKGLRPFYGCVSQYNQANADSNPTNNIVRVYGEDLTIDGHSAGCPPAPSGNWGFADFRDSGASSPGNSTLTDWVTNGYSGSSPVIAGHDYSTAPGASLGSNGISSALDQLIANKTPVLLALIDSVSGSGSNTTAHVSSFVGFVFTGYQANSGQGGPYVEGYFTRYICNEQCSTGTTVNYGNGIVKLRLAS
jgi:hypothetical protein